MSQSVRRRRAHNPPPRPTPLGADTFSVTAFYNHHCYTLLAAVVAINLVAGGYYFFSSPTTAWTHLIPVLILTLGVPATIFSFVEEKKEIHLPKRIATLAVAILVPVIQVRVGVAKDEHYEKRSRIEDANDIVLYREAFEVIKASDYQPGSKAEDDVREVIPTLTTLSQKYPYHRQLLYALGLAQFETHQFDEAETIV